MDLTWLWTGLLTIGGALGGVTLGSRLGKNQWLREQRRISCVDFLAKVDDYVKQHRTRLLSGPGRETPFPFPWSNELAGIAVLGPESLYDAAQALDLAMFRELVSMTDEPVDHNAVPEARALYLTRARAALSIK